MRLKRFLLVRKRIVDFKELLANEEVMLLSNINDVAIATDEPTTVSAVNVVLDAGMARLDVTCNAVTLVLLKDEMDEDTLSCAQGFYEELDRCVKFNETCPEGHVNVLSVCIVNTSTKDSDGLMMTAPLIWAVDDATNCMKIVFDKECVFTIEGN